MALTLLEGYSPSVSADSDSTTTNVSRIYYVTSDDAPADIELQVLKFSELPSVGDSISVDYPSVKVDKKTVQPYDTSDESGDFYTWKVTITYKAESTDGGDREAILNAKPVISFGSQQYERTVERGYKDVDPEEGNPTEAIENSIGDPFDPPVTVAYSNQYVTIQQNLDSFDPTWIKDYENTTNLNSMKIAGIRVEPEQARMLSITASPQTDDDGDEYWQVGYEIEISKEGFLKQILNAGLNLFEESIGKRPIKYSDIGNNGDDKDEFVNEPQKLDESGGVIDPDSAQEPVYIPFKVYFPKKWNTLNIPTDV